MTTKALAESRNLQGMALNARRFRMQPEIATELEQMPIFPANLDVTVSICSPLRPCRAGMAKLPRLLALACLLWSSTTGARATSTQDVIDLPFEQLLATEIVSADKLARQISDAASAVSIVTADDIRIYGYRTLGDILNGMRGLYMSRDDSYGFLAGRGYGQPGSYAGRITLLIDGYRAADNYFGQIYFGRDGLLDVELIERVEYIPGAGSSSYGDSAFLGVINVITKKGESFDGTQLSQEFGSHGMRQSRLTFGRRFDSGLDLLVSASGYTNRGRSIAPGDTTLPAAGRFEDESNRRFFLKAAYRGWRFETAGVERPIVSPYTAPAGSGTTTDTSAFSSLRHDGDLSDTLKISTHLYWGQYRYLAKGIDPTATTFGYSGRWQGIDSKLVGTWFDRHTLVFGAEYRNDYQQDYKALFTWGDTYRIHANRETTSLYAYDDIALRDDLQLTLGGRLDKRDNGSHTASPRGALVYSPLPGTTLKLSTGIAHRQPTQDEENWATNATVERVRTRELVWEQALGAKTRLIGSLYRSVIDRRLDFYGGLLTAGGAEIEIEHFWNNGIRLRGSYARQDVREELSETVANSPRHNAKLNLSVPLLGETLRAGLAVRHLGKRLGSYKIEQPAGTVADLTLSGQWQNWSASLTARNLFDSHFVDVGGWVDYPMDRRNYSLVLNYNFR